MISITKPADPPKVLSDAATLKRVADFCEDCTLFGEEYRAGKRRFSFDARIYNHSSVKQALIQAQHGKCCFCEAKIEDEGDIEHYRPKSGSRQGAKEPLIRPGYYWLVYDWDNLLLACASCNQRFKRNLFPLLEPSRRALIHTDDLTLEEPLLINPAEQSPEECIAFRGEVPYAVDGNPAGETTIRVLGLKRRKKLNDQRRTRLKHLLIMWDLIGLQDEYQADPILADLIARAKVALAEAAEDSAEFASMARCAIGDQFRYALASTE